MKPVDAICPSCSKQGLQLFYEIDSVPVHNSLVVATRREAVDFPRGDLRVAVCERCGFITNTAFDIARLGYSQQYEDQQSFSPTFNAFAERLVDGLIERYGLRGGKSILEIGCGKGDFLALMVERGDNRGIGIDPTAVHSRLKGVAAERIAFINDLYSERYAAYSGDLICCRHTLEHIPDVAAFVGKIRASIGDRHAIPVFFEIPDVARVLVDTAYWDIYYEHCSYFTPGSFARLFRAQGFEVTDVRRDFDDQYLLLEAHVTDRPSERRFPIEERPEEVVRDAAAFERSIARTLEAWRTHFAAARSAGRKTAIWGSGSKCVAFLTTIGVEDDLDYVVVDINPHRHGKFVLGVGKEIVPPQFLRSYRPDEVIVMNAIYRAEIERMLAELGVETRLITADEHPLEAVA
jgi:SAM-dependent methyltransferase